MDRDLAREWSQRLSWLLRHGARETGIAMDAAGWVAMEEVLRALLGLDAALLDMVVRTNTKSRLEVAGGRIRAAQGHSPAGVPVTHDALEASWERHGGERPLWHGTRAEALSGIAAAGILPGERTHVHLAESADSRVGKRSGVDVLIEVDPARLRSRGLDVFRAANGVILTRRVPRDCIVGLLPATARARRDEAALRALLGLPPR